jgi:SAM-dependent methyltransferase
MYLDWFQRHAQKKEWTNIKYINATVEDTGFLPHYYDFIFARWVIAFVSDAEKFLVKLLSALRPGGIIAFQDYYYEGLSLFPHGGPFDRMADVVRAYYHSNGGDAYITGRIPALFRKYGLRTIDFAPHSMAGGPDSGIMEWAHRFFTVHTRHMVEKNLITQIEGEAMLDDWNAHRTNPDAIFFSPIVVDVAGVQP